MKDLLRQLNPDLAVLAIDVDQLTTRALLFEIAEGQYRFTGMGQAPTTTSFPERDINDGVFLALQDLQRQAQHRFLDDDSRLITPVDKDDLGVDKMVATCSLGRPLAVSIIGLTDDLDIEAARKAAVAVNARLLEVISLSDERPLQEQVDSLLFKRPDVVLLTGGYDDGAKRSVARHAELLLLINRLLPEYDRPRVLYAGNDRLGQRVVEVLQKWVRIKVVPNLSPKAGAQNLMPAILELVSHAQEIAQAEVPGLKQLGRASSSPVESTLQNFGAIIRYLSKVYDPVKGVAGIWLGQTGSISARAVEGDLVTRYLSSYNPEQGGEDSSVSSLLDWLSLDIAEEEALDHLQQRQLLPGLLPVDEPAYAIEAAAMTARLRTLWRESNLAFDDTFYDCAPVFISGMDWGEASDLYTNLLIALNGIQPIGLTQFIFDQHNLLPALGAISQVNAYLPVQVLGSNAMLGTGPIIAPFCQGHPGSPALKVRIEYASGEFKTLEAKVGVLQKLPIKPGESARIVLETIGPTWLDARQRTHAADLKTTGGVFGGLLDTRPRPVTMPVTTSERLLQLMRWRADLELDLDAGRPAGVAE